jgi:hypothetical protein
MRINALIFSRPLSLVIMAGMIPGGDRSPRVKVFRETDGGSRDTLSQKSGVPRYPGISLKLTERGSGQNGAYFSTRVRR